jgi:hypothetical protein
LIIEGSVESFQDVSEEEFPCCSFVIVNARRYTLDDVPVQEDTRVKVRARGALAKYCVTAGIPDGTVAKAVGRLANDGWGGCSCVFLEAEHIEFKGGRKKKDSWAVSGEVS